MNTLFTIGHSNHGIEAFLALLAGHGVTVLADVRSRPYSRLFPHFCQAPLRLSLKAAGCAYLFLGRELGARPEDPACYAGGRVDYEKLAATGLFRQGIERLRGGAPDHRIALMCAERDPLDCHRALLVSRALHAAGLRVQHILADGALESHVASEARLRALAGLPESDMFHGAAETLALAYRLRAHRLAYQAPGSAGDEDTP